MFPSRRDAIRDFCAEGGGIAACLPYHYPRALLRAFGLLPVEIFGPAGRDVSRADAHLQAYICGLVRGPLAFLLEGGLSQAELILVPHGCDSLQGLGSLLKDFVQTPCPVETFYLPRGQSQAAACDFVAAEIAALYEKLAEHRGQRPSDQRLMECALREEDADLLLGRLLASRGRLELSNLEFYAIVRSREYLPAERFCALVGELLAEQIETPPAGAAAKGGPGILLSGIVPEPKGILETLDRQGVRVVGDDLACSGRRVYPPGSSERPFVRLAEALLGAPADSTRGDSVEARASRLLALAEGTGASALLFLPVKFCEPELFYLPQLRERLSQAGLPSSVLECDPTAAFGAQLETRLEAFLEQLDGVAGAGGLLA